MSVDAFWAIVEHAARARPVRDHPYRAWLTALSRLSISEIVAFQPTLIAELSRSDSYELYLASGIAQGEWLNLEDFESYRLRLMSMGRATYEQAIDDPDSLDDSHVACRTDDLWIFERLLLVSTEAYQNKTGERAGQRIQARIPTWSCPWDEDPNAEKAVSLQRRFPRLWAIHRPDGAEIPEFIIPDDPFPDPDDCDAID